MASNPHITRGIRQNPFNENGKRERVNNEDDPEVVPLSKRMNNIHFEGGIPGPGQSSPHSQPHDIPEAPNGPGQYVQQDLNPGQGFTQNNVNGIMDHGDYSRSQNFQNGLQTYNSGMNNEHPNPSHMNSYLKPSEGVNLNAKESARGVPSPKDINYSPILGRAANPHYYEQNRMLFELYKERLERNHFPPHPNYG